MARIVPGNLLPRIGVRGLELSQLDTGFCASSNSAGILTLVSPACPLVLAAARQLVDLLGLGVVIADFNLQP